jgi:hypothetical protein
MSAQAWSAGEYPGDPDPWKFVISDPKCACGWFLADAAPPDYPATFGIISEAIEAGDG